MKHTLTNSWTRRLVIGIGICALAQQAAAQTLLYADGTNNRVQQVGWPAGAPTTTLVPTMPSLPALPVMVKRGPDGMLYVTEYGAVNGVRRYYPDGTEDTTFVLPPGGNLATPFGLAFHPTTRHLYVSDVSKVVCYDLDAGTVVFMTALGLTSPTGLAFDGAGNLYACDLVTSSVCRKTPSATGFTTLVGSGAGGLNGPMDLLISGSQIYVSSGLSGQVLRYAWSNGAYLGVEAPTGTETLPNVFGLERDENGDIYVSCFGNGNIEKYKPTGAGHLGTFSTGTGTLGLCLYEDEPAPFPARAREVVATFCPDLVFPGVPNPAGPCVKVVDARTGGPTGRNWPAPMFSNDVPNPLAPDAWTYQNLGAVFAVAVDEARAPNIYVAATTAYGSFPFGPGGGGGVYKLQGCDGEIEPWIVTGNWTVGGNKLPNADGVGLGDICYDRYHHQFFVSNMQDGKIYRFTDAGTKASAVDVWDPFGANLVSGLPPLGDRIWGLHVWGDPYSHTFNGKYLVFSVWLRDSAHTGTAWPAWLVPFVGTNNPNNALFVVQLDATGKIVPASLTLLKVMPHLSATETYSNPVSDISSYARWLFTSEKTMAGPGIPGVLGQSHYARTLRLQHSTGIPVQDLYKVGDVTVSTLKGCNAAGGVAIDALRRVWSSGDAIQYPGYTTPWNGDLVYGLQRFEWKGNLASTPSYSTQTKLIDLDWNVTSGDKSQPGDVEVFPFTADMSNCPSSSTGGGGGGHL